MQALRPVRYFEGMISNRPAPYEIEVEGHPVDCDFLRLWRRGGRANWITRRCYSRRQRVGQPNIVLWLRLASDRIDVSGPVGAVDVQNGSLNVLGFPIQALPVTSSLMQRMRMETF